MSLESAIVLFILMLIAQIPILVAAIVAYLKSRAALEANTKLTKEGTEAAATNAQEAAEAAKSVSVTTESIDKKLNGGLHSAIHTVIEPELKEIKEKFGVLVNYVHDRNHDILGGMQVLSNQMNQIAQKMGEEEKKEEAKHE